MRANHHPSEATLLAYAAGQLSEGLSLVVATHLAWCPSCADAVAAAETVGGVLLSEASATVCSEDLLSRTFQALGQRPASDVPPRAAMTGASTLAELELPQPLRGYLDALGEARWRWLGLGIAQIRLIARTGGGGTVRLLRINPGMKMPRHSHVGTELSVILSGAYRDEIGRFGRGDFADHDEDVTHQPHADEREGCVCLITTEGPLRFEGLLARLIQPVIGF